MVKWIDTVNDSLLNFAEWAGKNFKAVASVLAFLIVVGGVWAGISYTHESKSKTALAAFAPIEKDFSAWKTPEAPKSADAKDKKAEAVAAKVDPSALFARMMDYIKTQGDVPAGQLMSLMASEVAAVLGTSQEAELLEVTKKTFKNGSHLMDGLVQMKEGDLFANQDKCDQAISRWKDVLSNKRLSYLHDMARLKSGLCLEKMAQYSEAEAQYDQIINGAKNPKESEKTAQAMRQSQWTVKEAQKLKRALKWSQKQPST